MPLLFVALLMAAVFMFVFAFMNLRCAVRHFNHGYTQAANFCIGLSVTEMFAAAFFVLLSTLV